MKIITWSSIFLLSVFFMWAFIPQASAKHHNRSRSSFGLSFNIAPAPRYVPVAPVPVAPVAPIAVVPNPYGARPVYPYPYYAPVPGPGYYAPAPAYVQRSAIRPHVQPNLSYSYWRY